MLSLQWKNPFWGPFISKKRFVDRKRAQNHKTDFVQIYKRPVFQAKVRVHAKEQFFKFKKPTSVCTIPKGLVFF